MKVLQTLAVLTVRATRERASSRITAMRT